MKIFPHRLAQEEDEDLRDSLNEVFKPQEEIAISKYDYAIAKPLSSSELERLSDWAKSKAINLEYNSIMDNGMFGVWRREPINLFVFRIKKEEAKKLPYSSIGHILEFIGDDGTKHTANFKDMAPNWDGSHGRPEDHAMWKKLTNAFWTLI